MKHLFAIAVVFLSTCLSFGQSKKELVELGDQAYNRGNYASAAYFYLKIVQGGQGGKYDITFPYEINTFSAPLTDKDTSSQKVIKTPKEERQQYVVHKLADSFRKLKDYDNARLWYAEAAQIPHDEFPHTLYWYGSSQMKLGDYANAQASFDQFISTTDDSDPFKSLASDKQISCQYALNPDNHKTGVLINAMDSIFNNGTSSFAASYYEGELSLMFTSARSTSTVLDKKTDDPRFHADVYTTQNVGNGWEPAIKMPEPISSGMHEGSSALSTDRTTFYYTRWDNDDKTNCHIMVSKKFNNQWMIPLTLNTINVEGYRSMNPCLSLDEQIIYFVSDMPGGLGGLDIWAAEIDDNANIGTPYNLGPSVNTPEDEMSPFHHFQSNTLYFSSEGHIGFGGMDVFFTKLDDQNNTWSTPINLGAPLNSSKDDTYYILDRNQKYGYLTSDREKCADCDSLLTIKGYCNKIYTVERPALEFSISGIVFDAVTMEPISNSLITFKDIKGSFTPFFVMTDDEGYYEKELEANMDIFMKAQKSKYFGDAATASTTGLTESTALTQDFYLNTIPPVSIAIEGIEYDFDKASLRKKSKEVLDNLFDFLEINDNLNVEIQSHTDFRGDDNYNLDLSERRAQSVVDYLVDKGIPRERLMAKGYGETEPAIVLDKDKKAMKDENGEFLRLNAQHIAGLQTQAERETAHQRNRRTAFKVLSENNEVIQKSANQ